MLIRGAETSKISVVVSEDFMEEISDVGRLCEALHRQPEDAHKQVWESHLEQAGGQVEADTRTAQAHLAAGELAALQRHLGRYARERAVSRVRALGRLELDGSAHEQ